MAHNQGTSNRSNSNTLTEYCRLIATSQVEIVDMSHCNLSRNDLVHLANAMMISFSMGRCSLRALDLSHNHLSHTDLVPIVQVMARWIYRFSYHQHAPSHHNSFLQQLNLSHNQIRDASTLLDMVFLLSSLEELCLDHNPLEDNDTDEKEQRVMSTCNMIQKTLSDRRTNNRSSDEYHHHWHQQEPEATSALRIEHRPRRDAPSPVLPPPITNTMPTVLDFSGLQLGDEGLYQLLSAFRIADVSIQNLKTLLLTGNSIGVAGGCLLADFVRVTPHCRLEVLQLDYNALQSAGVVALAEALGGNNDNDDSFCCPCASVGSLFLARNGCGDQGATALAATIAQRHDKAKRQGHDPETIDCLSTLGLIGNQITAVGAQALARVFLGILSGPSLWSFSSLRTLHLGDNMAIGDEGAAFLARAIQDCWSHTSLEEKQEEQASREENAAVATTTTTANNNNNNNNTVSSFSFSSSSSSAVTVYNTYLSLWRCGLTNGGATDLLDAVETTTANTATGSNHQKRHEVVVVVDLDLEWNNITNDEIKARLETCKHNAAAFYSDQNHGAMDK